MIGGGAWLLSLLGALAAAAAEAAAPADLRLPLDCQPGATCWIIRYVDHDPGPGVQDYRCGPLSGDGHKGTDFALRDLAAIDAGVEVRAAAAGTVIGRRDGVVDQLLLPARRAAIAGIECGNGVRLDHGDGWQTFYCHLRRGSVAVQEGDRVVAGQRLGLVGLSGETDFPHLHFDLRHAGTPVDPFAGSAGGERCTLGRQPYWQAGLLSQLRYQRPILTSSGIAGSEPAKDDVRKGWHQAESLPATSPLLSLWLDGYWFGQGDRVWFRLTGPDGQPVIDRRFEIGRDHQRWFGFASAPRPDQAWPAGRYEGRIEVERGGDEAGGRATLTSSVTVP